MDVSKLRKIVKEVYEPKPGDEKRFFNKHVVAPFDPQGKDSISSESPYELIKRNIDAVGKDKSKASSYEPGQDEDVYEQRARYRKELDPKTGKLRKVYIGVASGDEEGRFQAEQVEGQSLVESMKTALADTFALYLKAHNFHWNVEGADFPQYHEFLGKLYEEVFGAVDMIAERIRVLGDYAPGSLEQFSKLSTIKEQELNLAPSQMFRDLMMANQLVISSLTTAYRLAEQHEKLGVSNFLQDRIDIHEKHDWMLRSIVKQAVVSEATGLPLSRDALSEELRYITEARDSMPRRKMVDNTPAARFRQKISEGFSSLLEGQNIKEGREVVGVTMHYIHPRKKPFTVTHFSVKDAERGKEEYEKKGYKLARKSPMYAK